MPSQIIEPIHYALILESFLSVLQVYLIRLFSFEVAAQVFKLTDESVVFILLVLRNPLEPSFPDLQLLNTLLESLCSAFDDVLALLTILLDFLLDLDDFEYLLLLLLHLLHLDLPLISHLLYLILLLIQLR